MEVIITPEALEELEFKLECTAADLYIAETGLKAVLACFRTKEEKFRMIRQVETKLSRDRDNVENIMEFIKENLV